MSLHRCVGSTEPLHLAYVISTKISCAGPYSFSFQCYTIEIGDIFVWFDLRVRLYTNKCAKNNFSTIPEMK